MTTIGKTWEALRDVEWWIVVTRDSKIMSRERKQTLSLRHSMRERAWAEKGTREKEYVHSG